MNKVFRGAMILLLVFAGMSLLMPGYYLVKARLAQNMLEDAWEMSQADKGSRVKSNQVKPGRMGIEQIQKPWPWADTWPVAKLTLLKSKHQPESIIPQYEELDSFIVLANASGESLAFGPGLLTSDLMPGEKGNSLIAAHRDTHFAMLKNISINDRMVIERQDGTTINFEVDDIRVIDSTLQKPVVNIDEFRMTLVTCFPFDMEVKDPKLRLLVSGKKVTPHNQDNYVVLTEYAF